MKEEREYNFFRFEDLRLYDKALAYVEWVNNAVKLFHEIGSNGLSDKFLDASQNIALNIAEGSGRNRSQFIYHLKTVKTHIRKCIVYTTLAERLDYISETSREDSRNYLIEISKMLSALISSLQRDNRDNYKGNQRENVDGNINENEVSSEVEITQEVE